MSRTTAIPSDSSLHAAESRHELQRQAIQFLADLPALPFSHDDITAGSESELQAAVCGRSEDVDLPRTIHASNYVKNIRERTAAGESPRILIRQLQELLTSSDATVWENSWVRFPRRCLNRTADQLLERDLAADKRDPRGPRRADVNRYLSVEQGEEWVRLPISYLLTLTLADVLGEIEQQVPALASESRHLLDHFLNDNSSPETFSFHVSRMEPSKGMGAGIARETAIRFLLTQLLVLYANWRFGLEESGQSVLVYASPHPPLRQRRLNHLVSDAFYRELFMNPCLSGWERGEEKSRYMGLCHEVLSRSQLNAVLRLKDAGIITRNLVVLPSTSNISLANNGTHLSLGSRRVSEVLRAGTKRYTPAHEKVVGDLVIKIVEHFLPLFVGTYSAAPYRMNFRDFHPELALGFLPHELDFTHLRMLWRRWKKKARLSVFGRAITPVGPLWLDRALSALFQLRGDYVPDFRLIDYLVSLLSTDQSPALDGLLGNEFRLKRDLGQLGVFDERMSLYLCCKLRAQSVMGFSGFEGRHYSLFSNHLEDFADAAALQALVTALAFRYIAAGQVTHEDIPDDPFSESERRQCMFASAIGIATVNVRESGPNLFLARLVGRTQKTRSSRRYAGHLRVRIEDYRLALLATLEDDAPDLIEAFHLGDHLARLRERLLEPDRCSTAGKLTRGIVGVAGVDSPMQLCGEEFAQAAEGYYRGPLRAQYIREALTCVGDDLRAIDQAESETDRRCRGMATALVGPRSAAEALTESEPELLSGAAGSQTLLRSLGLCLLAISRSRALNSHRDEQSGAS
ncbi:MAG: hypothetical protein GDA68_08520 [Nitrospira sp. CR2.1]|nr:hypothetical protein [Nitrospira sp. CR2.1]